MNGKTFVDTNILLYAYDRDAGTKHHQAKAILQDLWTTRKGMMSVQILEEFYVNVTRKIPRPLSSKNAREIMGAYLAWDVVAITPSMMLEASLTEERFKLSFWDALVIIAARQGGASLLLSEDFQHGQRIEGITIQNPFRSLPKEHPRGNGK